MFYMYSVKLSYQYFFIDIQSVRYPCILCSQFSIILVVCGQLGGTLAHDVAMKWKLSAVSEIATK